MDTLSCGFERACFLQVAFYGLNLSLPISHLPLDAHAVSGVHGAEQLIVGTTIAQRFAQTVAKIELVLFQRRT